MENVKVSIIVPIYNSEKYLEKCLTSLINQSLKDIEIILIDDASTDSSGKIMEHYRNRYPSVIQCLYFSKNMKQGAARNRGLEIATGEYVTFVDSDDYVSYDLCKKLYEKAKEQQADIVYCDYYNCFINQNQIKYVSYISDEILGELTPIKRKISLFSNPMIAGKIIKRSIITEYNIVFPEGIFYEDIVVSTLFLLYARKIDLVREPLYYVGIRETSTISRTDSDHHFDESKAMILMLDEIKERKLYEEYKDELDMLFLLYFYMHPLKRIVEKFAVLPLNQMKYLKEYVDGHYADFENNPYYFLVDNCECYSYIKENERSPQKFKERIEHGQYDKSTENYKDGYYKRKDKIIQLLSVLCNKGNVLAIWGAGKKGQNFLEVCDPCRKYISQVFDKNINTYGKQLPTKHIVVDYNEYLTQNDVDVIFCMNQYHYNEVRELVNSIHPSTIVINFEIYIRFGYENNIEKYRKEWEIEG